MRLADGGHRGEIEGGEGFALRQAGLRHMPGDAARLAIGQLMLAEYGEEARAAPAFAVGMGAELPPDPADRR